MSDSKDQSIAGKAIIALCTLSMCGQLMGELSGNLFGTYIVKGLGLDPIWWGLINAVNLVCGAIAFFIVGAISDNLRTRWGRRVPLIFIGMESTALLTILFALTTNLIWIFINGGILIAITNSMWGIRGSLIPDMVPNEKRGRMNTLLTVMTPIGSLLVYIPALIPVISGNKNASQSGVIIMGAIILALIGLIVPFLVNEPPAKEAPPGVLNDLRRTFNWQEMKQHKTFLILFAANFFVAAADNAIFSNLFNFIDTINFDLIQIAIYGPIVGAVIGIGLYSMGKATDYRGRKGVTILGFVIAPFGSWIIALAGNNILYLMLGFAIFFPFYLGGGTAQGSWQQDALPESARGRFNGIMAITSAVGSGLGGIVANVLAHYYGYFYIFIASAIFLWISIPFYIRAPETLIKKSNSNNPPPEMPKEAPSENEFNSETSENGV